MLIQLIVKNTYKIDYSKFYQNRKENKILTKPDTNKIVDTPRAEEEEKPSNITTKEYIDEPVLTVSSPKKSNIDSLFNQNVSNRIFKRTSIKSVHSLGKPVENITEQVTEVMKEEITTKEEKVEKVLEKRPRMPGKKRILKKGEDLTKVEDNLLISSISTKTRISPRNKKPIKEFLEDQKSEESLLEEGSEQELEQEIDKERIYDAIRDEIVQIEETNEETFLKPEFEIDTKFDEKSASKRNNGIPQTPIKLSSRFLASLGNRGQLNSPDDFDTIEEEMSTSRNVSLSPRRTSLRSKYIYGLARLASLNNGSESREKKRSSIKMMVKF